MHELSDDIKCAIPRCNGLRLGRLAAVGGCADCGGRGPKPPAAVAIHVGAGASTLRCSEVGELVEVRGKEAGTRGAIARLPGRVAWNGRGLVPRRQPASDGARAQRLVV